MDTVGRPVSGLAWLAVWAGRMPAKTRRFQDVPTGRVASIAIASLICWAQQPIDAHADAKAGPNIVLFMSDDQGWAETGYNRHPFLKTPNLDSMAANGLVFERFYAAAPTCSSSRAGVLTGRSNDRTGVRGVGYPLRPQERTLADALRDIGYQTAFFGKWHLNGLAGPGAPVLKEDPLNPGAFGFDTWIASTNFFDSDPLLGSNAAIAEYRGESSALLVDSACAFMESASDSTSPFLLVIWAPSPHYPYIASAEDRTGQAALDLKSQHHGGEIVALDRGVGALRTCIRDLGIAESTIFWYSSDNGGATDVRPSSVGALRGGKGTLWEGGVRVPSVVEWPGRIQPGKRLSLASSLDISPTILDLVGLPPESGPLPLDGESLAGMLSDPQMPRSAPIPFRYEGRGALVGDRFKLVSEDLERAEFAFYDLENDPTERADVSSIYPVEKAEMEEAFLRWSADVDASAAGRDYIEGSAGPDREPVPWFTSELYRPHLAMMRARPEYRVIFEKPSTATRWRNKLFRLSDRLCRYVAGAYCDVGTGDVADE